MSVEDEKLKNEYRALINSEYESYANASKNSPNETSVALRKLMEKIPVIYSEYYALYCEKQKSKVENQSYADDSYLGIMYLETFGTNNFLYNLILNYQKDKGTFFDYLNSAVRIRTESAIKKKSIDDKRGGIKDVFTGRERKVLSLLFKTMEKQADIDDWREKEYHLFCISAGINESNWKDVALLYKRAKNVQERNRFAIGENGEEIDLIDIDSYKNKEKYEVEHSAFEENKNYTQIFHSLIEHMDLEMYPRLTAKQKTIWPDLYTGEFTSKHIEVNWSTLKKNKSGEIRRQQVIEEYWNYLKIEDLREEYGFGKYLFIADPIFEYIIAERKEVTLKYLSEKHNSCSQSYLCNEKNRMLARIKENFEKNIFDC